MEPLSGAVASVALLSVEDPDRRDSECDERSFENFHVRCPADASEDSRELVGLVFEQCSVVGIVD